MTTPITKKSKTQVPIDYTKKGFNEIKADLKKYIERYYPNTYQDFNQSSFGSMMLDLVSYVGDQLHYYLDHNANEANPVFAKETENVFQGLAALGAKPNLVNLTTGYIDVYYPVPSDPLAVGIDLNYILTSHAGSKYRSEGGNMFTQMEDVVVNASNSEIIGHKTTTDGSKISYFLLKVKIPVVSGETKTYTVDVGSYRKFLKIEIPDEGVTEILKIEDSNKNEYFEVDHLAQNVIYKPIIDPSSETKTISTTNSRLKPVPVPRRFIVERGLNRAHVVFGYGSDDDLKTNSVADPSKVAINATAKSYVSTPKMDPSNLLSSNKLGVAPQDTTITITYRNNSTSNSNAAVGTVNQVADAIISFNNEQLLDAAKVSFIRENLQVFNEEPINGNVSIPNTEELKKRYMGSYSAQGRAVTKQDYISSVYSMPANYGAIKRAAIIRDTNDLRRNLNMYLISEGADGKFQVPSMLMKQNVKTWLNSVRMVSDSIDIFDANIINLGIEIKAQVALNVNAQTALANIKRKIYDELMVIPPDIGEPFYISEVYRILRSIPEVAHVPQRDGVVIRPLVGGGSYSSYSYDISSNISLDESYLYIPENSIWEIKFIDDIKGTIIA